MGGDWGGGEGGRREGGRRGELKQVLGTCPVAHVDAKQ